MRINYITDESLWNCKMSIGRRLYVESVAKSENLNVKFAADSDCDVIWAYKTGSMNLYTVDKPKITVFNEANDAAKTMQDISDTDANHCVFHHYGDYMRWKADLKDMGVTSSWQPHAGFIGVDDLSWNMRDIPCILTGSISATVYPLRYRYQTALNHGLEAFHVHHPGYRFENHRQVKSQYLNYASMLRRSKISLCCTSIHRYPLAKLYESAAAGCVIATDKPECPMFEEYVWPHCIQLDASMLADEITSKIRSYSQTQLLSMAEKTHAAWKEYFTVQKWTERFLEQVRTLA